MQQVESDTGSGMVEGKKPKIFEIIPYFIAKAFYL